MSILLSRICSTKSLTHCARHLSEKYVCTKIAQNFHICQDTADWGKGHTICGSSKIANENRCQLTEASEAKAPGKHDGKFQRRKKWHFVGAFICAKVEASNKVRMLSEGLGKSSQKLLRLHQGRLSSLILWWLVQSSAQGCVWRGEAGGHGGVCRKAPRRLVWGQRDKGGWVWGLGRRQWL